jgi:hypothetical protein
MKSMIAAVCVAFFMVDLAVAIPLIDNGPGFGRARPSPGSLYMAVRDCIAIDAAGNCGSLATYGHPTTWDISQVTTTISLFTGNARHFNQDIGPWNMSSVTRTDQMFELATAFNQTIGSWDMSKVTDTGYMFNQAVAFNQSGRAVHLFRCIFTQYS